MLIIFFGIVGVIVGYYFMGYNLIILSMIGFFGLVGILVNNLIILVVCFEECWNDGEDLNFVVISVSCDWLWVVLFMLMMIIGGLLLFLFEISF